MTKRETLQIDLARYKHLTNKTPMNIWVSEFLHRNKEFRTDIAELAKMLPSAHMRGKMTREERENIDRMHQEEAQWVMERRIEAVTFRHEEKEYMIKYIEAKYRIKLPLKVMLTRDMLEKLGERVVLRIDTPDVVSNLRVYGDDDKEIVHDMIERWNRRKIKESVNIAPAAYGSQNILHLLLGCKNEKDFQGMSNQLLIAVNVNSLTSRRKKEEILDEIGKVLSIHRKQRAERAHMKNWKYYLIAYDYRERNPKPAWDSLAEALSDAFPENADWQDGNISGKNVMDFYRASKKLIKGGYQSFI